MKVGDMFAIKIGGLTCAFNPVGINLGCSNQAALR